MTDTQKALDLLGLPQDMLPFNGQVQTKSMRMLRIYEVYDYTNGKPVLRYEAEFQQPTTQLFGAYPFNLLASYVYHSGFNIIGQDGDTYKLDKPGKWIMHTAPSSLAGQNVYYSKQQIRIKEQPNGYAMDLLYEPWSTTINNNMTASDMKNPEIGSGIGVFGKIVKKGMDGKPYTAWTSRYAIKPKKPILKSDVLALTKLTEDEIMEHLKWTFNIVSVSPITHITSIAMDIEQLGNDQYKSVFYINGKDAKTYDYRYLTTSFGQKSQGYMWQWRLYNGNNPAIVDNAYGSTINIGLNENEDSTITVKAGNINQWDAKTRVMTYDVTRPEQAEILAYMEFLPAGGKNENIGQSFNLETQVESLF
jgi:hypothetical protein